MKMEDTRVNEFITELSAAEAASRNVFNYIFTQRGKEPVKDFLNKYSPFAHKRLDGTIHMGAILDNWHVVVRKKEDERRWEFPESWDDTYAYTKDESAVDEIRLNMFDYEVVPAEHRAFVMALSAYHKHRDLVMKLSAYQDFDMTLSAYHKHRDKHRDFVMRLSDYNGIKSEKLGRDLLVSVIELYPYDLPEVVDEEQELVRFLETGAYQIPTKGFEGFQMVNCRYTISYKDKPNRLGFLSSNGEKIKAKVRNINLLIIQEKLNKEMLVAALKRDFKRFKRAVVAFEKFWSELGPNCTTGVCDANALYKIFISKENLNLQESDEDFLLPTYENSPKEFNIAHYLDVSRDLFTKHLEEKSAVTAEENSYTNLSRAERKKIDAYISDHIKRGKSVLEEEIQRVKSHIKTLKADACQSLVSEDLKELGLVLARNEKELAILQSSNSWLPGFHYTSELKELLKDNLESEWEGYEKTNLYKAIIAKEAKEPLYKRIVSYIKEVWNSLFSGAGTNKDLGVSKSSKPSESGLLNHSPSDAVPQGVGNDGVGAKPAERAGNQPTK